MIGVAPPYKTEVHYYTEWLKKRNLPYKILKKEDTLEGCDIFMLCGGADIGKKPDRDQKEFKWFDEASEKKIPILGICRGMQLANVALGGTLHEDLLETKVKHTTNKIEIAGDKPLSESSYHEVLSLRSDLSFKVNSRHHQGVDVLAKSLFPIAWCKEDSLVEAASGDNSLYVQWHPEREEVYDTPAEQMCYIFLEQNLKT